MLIAVVNESSLVSDADVYNMTLVVSRQVRQHVAPPWGGIPPMVRYTKVIPTAPGTAVIGILDDPDQADALGWHAQSAAGVVYGRVFARPVLSNGGNALTNPLSVASVLSHEVIETYLDPYCNMWGDDGIDTAYAREGCDPVESDTYTITLGTGAAAVTATVSDFLLPNWFNATPAAGAAFDYLHLLKRPFEVRPTGYVITLKGGHITSAYGERYPAWRRATKRSPLARTSQRLHRDRS